MDVCCMHTSIMDIWEKVDAAENIFVDHRKCTFMQILTFPRLNMTESIGGMSGCTQCCDYKYQRLQTDQRYK